MSTKYKFLCLLVLPSLNGLRCLSGVIFPRIPITKPVVLLLFPCV